MNRLSHLRTLALLSPALLAVAACASSKQSVGVGKVDDLMTRIERTYVESELAQEKIHASYDMLQTIASADFQGDPVEAFAQFTITIDMAEKQVEAHGDCIEPMKKSGAMVFDQWQKDLEAFSSPTLRERSEERFRETRRRFGAITALIDPTQEALEAFALTLRDHAFFLSHDLNAASLSAISADVDALGEKLDELDAKLTACQAAARNYVKAAALPGTVDMTAGDAATDETEQALDPNEAQQPEAAPGEQPARRTAPARRQRRSAPNTRNFE